MGKTLPEQATPSHFAALQQQAAFGVLQQQKSSDKPTVPPSLADQKLQGQSQTKSSISFHCILGVIIIKFLLGYKLFILLNFMFWRTRVCLELQASGSNIVI